MAAEEAEAAIVIEGGVMGVKKATPFNHPFVEMHICKTAFTYSKKLKNPLHLRAKSC